MAEGTLGILNKENERLRGENAKRRANGKKLQSQLDEALKENGTLKQKVTEYEQKGGEPSQLQKTIDELTSENRRLKHGARFRDLAIAEGMLPEAVEDAWDILKIKADTDEPDEDGMKATLEAAKAKKPHLFGPVDNTDPSKSVVKPVPPAFGGNRGKDGPVGLVLLPEQRRDPKFMAQNAEAIKKHTLAGTITYKD